MARNDELAAAADLKPPAWLGDAGKVKTRLRDRVKHYLDYIIEVVYKANIADFNSAEGKLILKKYKAGHTGNPSIPPSVKLEVRLFPIDGMGFLIKNKIYID